jgi:hypothetical protein
MQGRRFKFTYGTGADYYEVAACDFWVDYMAGGGLDGGRDLRVALRRIWLLPAAGLSRDQIRAWSEDLVKSLVWTLWGKQGSLKWAIASDSAYTGALARTLAGMTLSNVVFRKPERQGALEFDLEFSYPVDAHVARTLLFDQWGGGTTTLAYQTFVLQWSKQDRTVFTPTWRAAPCRIPAGAPLTVLKITALQQAITGSTDLARRGSVEDSLKNWVSTIGKTGTLTIDGAAYATAMHLRDARAGQQTWLDATSYELEFVTGYV